MRSRGVAPRDNAIDLQTQPSRSCLQCDASLDGVPGRKCPACGLLFDPMNRRTFRTPVHDEPREWWQWSAKTRTIVGAVALTLTLGVYESSLWTGTILLNSCGVGSLLWIFAWFGFPLWSFLFTLWALALIQSPRLHGMLTWMIIGAAIGTFIGGVQTVITAIVGCAAGIAAGLMRHYWEI